METKRTMKNVLFIIASIFFGISGLAQSPTTSRTYSLEHSIHVEGITDVTDINGLDRSEKSTAVQYLDGLGRPLQTVSHQSSPGGFDMVKYYEYDSYGRQTKSYLPYTSTSTNASYNGGAKTSLLDFYNTAPNVAHDTEPWSAVSIEYSPLARIYERAAVGAAWTLSNNKTTRYTYTLNASADNVFKWDLTSSGGLILHDDTYYAANKLSVTKVVGENLSGSDNNGVVFSFTNQLGQQVLSRTYENGAAFDTYYVYDDYGNMVYTIPPEAIQKIMNANADDINNDDVFTSNYTFSAGDAKNKTYYYMPGVTVTLPTGYTFTDGFNLKPYPIDDEFLKDWLFINKYNAYNQLIERKSPGADWIHYVHDKRGRVIMSQDGNQRTRDEWTFTKYDVHDRPLLTGMLIDGRSRSSLETEVRSQMGDSRTWYEGTGSTVHGYSNNSYPNVSDESKYVLVTYYDDYAFASGWNSKYNFQTGNGINDGPTEDIVRGLETGGKIRVLGTSTWLKTVTYYDKHHRPIQSVADHYVSDEVSRSYTEYTWSGEVVRSRYEHVVDASKTITLDERFEYDEKGRLLRTYHDVDGEGEVLMADYSYNELGELIDKKVHSTDGGSSFLQSLDYRSNIRGWTTSINNAGRTNDGSKNDDTGDLFGMEFYYNTNPSGLSYTTNQNGQLTAATWSNATMGTGQRSYGYSYDKVGRLKSATYKEKTTGSWTVKQNHYNVENITYDKNGNIKTLDRKHEGTLVDDLSYSYDANQLSAINDATNNDLGFKDGAESSVEYTYDANGNVTSDGNKLISSITYNVLNKPERVTFVSGDYIEYTYDAAGIKLAQRVYVDGMLQEATDYSGGFIFQDDRLTQIATAEGRLRVDQIGADYNYDYQYMISDHLGNTRVMYAQEVEVFKATMESEKAGVEEAHFLNVDKGRVIGPNHTASGNESVMLNATKTYGDGTRRIIGPSKALKLYPGDEVDMEVWGKYEGVNSGNQNTTSMLFDVVSAAYGIGASGATEAFNTALSNVFGTSTVLAQNGSDVPAAYLNYIFFDKDFNDTPIIGLDQVSTSAASNFEKLALDFTATKEGYLFIYVSNESSVDRDVFFDDFTITKTSNTSVWQSEDYYPFGLPIAGNNFTKEGIEANRFLYQGKEWQTQLGLNLYDFHARQYDPATGRFLGVDPQGQFGSPYLAMGNMPTMSIDPDGELVWFVPVIIGAVVGAYSGASIQSGNWNPNQWDSDWYKGAVVGALIGAAAGAGVAAAIGPTSGISGITTSAGTASQGWGITTSALQSANINIATNFIEGRGLDGAWKAGLFGLASGSIASILSPVFENSDFLYDIFGFAADRREIGQFGYQIVNGSIYGFADRYTRASELGYSGGETFRTALLGFLEGGLSGFYGGRLGTDFDVSFKNQKIFSSVVSSIPGLGFSMSKYFGYALAAKYAIVGGALVGVNVANLFANYALGNVVGTIAGTVMGAGSFYLFHTSLSHIQSKTNYYPKVLTIDDMFNAIFN